MWALLRSVAAVSGVLLLTDVAPTLAWQEPLSALMAKRSQAALEEQLRGELALAARDRTAVAAIRSPQRRLTALADRFERRLRRGRAVGAIALPTLHRRYTIVQGTDTATLRRGPAHYPDSPLPGQGGTVAIAGHRTTYLAPFRTIDQLRRGQPVVLTMPYGRFTYRLELSRIVRPDALWVKRPVGHERLILTAGHPLYSAARRIVVFARLTRAEPEEAGLAG